MHIQPGKSVNHKTAPEKDTVAEELQNEIRICDAFLNFRQNSKPLQNAKKGWIGQNWVNGLYYVKLNFQHDRNTF